eukprot:6492760-Amphidinium_carterae.1
MEIWDRSLPKRQKTKKKTEELRHEGPASSAELFDWPTWLVADMFRGHGFIAINRHTLHVHLLPTPQSQQQSHVQSSAWCLFILAKVIMLACSVAQCQERKNPGIGKPGNPPKYTQTLKNKWSALAVKSCTLEFLHVLVLGNVTMGTIHSHISTVTLFFTAIEACM